MADAPINQNLSRQTVSGLSWQMLSGVVRFVAQFGIGIALARLLPPEDFGIIGIAYIATGFASILTDLGLGPAIIQRKELTERHVRVCHTLSVMVAVAIGVVLYGSAGLVADFFKDARVEPVLQVLALTFPFSGFGITAAALLTRQMAFSTLVKIELITSIVGYGAVAVTMAALGYGYWSLVGGTIVQTVLATVLKYAATRHDLRPFAARDEFRDLFGFSAGMSLTSTANYFARQGDYFVVGRLMNATSLGLYSRAYSLMTLPLSFFGNALSSVLFPAASKVQDDPERFRRAFLTAFALSVAVSLPVSLAVVILAPEIILVLYGDKWVATIPLLQILAMFGVFRMSYNTAASFIKAKGQPYRMLASQLVYALLVIGGSWWAGQVAGLMGVAWAVGLAILSQWILVVVFSIIATVTKPYELARTMVYAAVPGVGTSAVMLLTVSGLRAASASPFVVFFAGFGVFAVISTLSLASYARRLDHPAVNEMLRKTQYFYQSKTLKSKVAIFKLHKSR